MTAELAYTELPRPKFGQRWLYKLAEPMRYSTLDGVDYESGRIMTMHVVVSWGTMGDTGIFPANELGQILDLLGYKTWPTWVPADEAMAEWLAAVSLRVEPDTEGAES